MTQESPRVFVSYRRRVASGLAGRARDALERSFGKDRVFYDVATIRGGTSFPEAIATAIDGCNVVVVIVGRTWTTRCLSRWLLGRPDWVRSEIEQAGRAGKHILPVLVEETRMPREAWLPRSIKFFSSLQAVRLRDDTWDDDIQRLVQAISTLAATPPTVRLADSAASFPRRTAFYLIGASIAVAAVLWAAGLIPSGANSAPPDGGSPVATSPNEIRSAVIQVRAANGAAATGFFITQDGYALTMLPDTKPMTSIVVRMVDGREFAARTVGRRSTMLTLLKLESSKNPYLAIATSDPARHLSVVVVGVDGRDNQWKSYAARIANNNAGTLLYDRPEQTWTGLMGAPIVDVNAEAVVGMHFGTTRPDSGTTPQGQGRSVAALELVELLKAGSVAATFR